ncbi:Flp pilus assembly protein CpaB [Acidithiobacillus sp. M4-SHS-6]|uniref:Flp pilus assembly protein CpaB n=1 Tax=Acidithiobacillus sp. M4-SHS-6 TaxID=3383024 RepID=UPI0039BEAE52
MGNKAKIAIAVLVLLAVLLGVAAYVISLPSSRVPPPAKAPSSTTAAPAGVAVVVASKALPAGQPIPAEALKVLHYPQFPSGAYHQARSVIGQVPVTSIGAGVPVLHSNMVSGLATQVPAGNLAMAIRVNEEIAVGDHLHPGDFVDVFTTLPGNEGQMHGGWPTQSRLLLAGLRVLAVGPQTVTHGLQPVAGQQGDIINGQTANGQQQPPSTVVLQVPVASAATLALASAQGHLLLALRNPKSNGMPDVQDFPLPTPALLPTKIPLGQRQAALQKPENRAYAGLTLPGLAGKSRAEAQAMRPLPPPPPMMQVYDGAQKTAVPY